MNEEQLRREWEAEEACAHIHGWDFSHIAGRYSGEPELPWSYEAIARSFLGPDKRILDYDTGGGEFLLSLGHPYALTAATEGYPPNVALCRETLLPLGIDFRPCADSSRVPFPDATFDLMLNRHGSFNPKECFRLLKPGGVFVTQQVGARNDRDMVDLVFPGTGVPDSPLYMEIQRRAFEEAGFSILQADEAFRPWYFTDVGAFVWFARIIEWEFTGFSVEKCFPRLMELQKRIEAGGRIDGTVHRYLIVAQKP